MAQARKKTARKSKPAERRHFVVSAGPTREHVDPVRYLSNESSGRMGFAIAGAAAKAGHQVTLVAGPVHIPTPEGVTRVDVVSAREMLAALRKAFAGADALVMCAAVCDWRPRRKLAGKWRKKDGGTESAQLDLVRNPDILATLAKGKGQRLVVGFALETGDGMRRARAKMKRKGTDFVVLNDPSALSGTRASVSILGSDGSLRELDNKTKDQIARVLVALEKPAFAGIE
jgi:phosphopantothenoylcysteine decarboxylase/phosphopantothenate--cysteine ligase